jgi:hypothetical protein
MTANAHLSPTAKPARRIEGKRMRWKKTLALSAILLTLVTLLCAPSANAQDYSFSLDQLEVNVWINDDGSVRLEYWLVFTCDPGAHPIDIVDLGLPNGDFRISDISAKVDGETPIDHVGSDFEGEGSDGVAIYLGQGTIAPGQTGKVAVQVERVGSMLYEDANDPEYASVEFAPAYYVNTVHGTTDMTVRFFLPEGVQPEEPRWHKSPSGWPSEPETDLHDGRVMYVWYNPAADSSRQHTFGASFPRKYVDSSVIQEAPSPLVGILASITSVASACCCNPFVYVIAFFVGVVGLSVWSQQRRKMKYLPPSMKVEGVGIKRGLTAVEASILLETPLNKVLTMILFGLLKKGAVTVLDDKPLKVQVNEPRPEKPHPYETDFLDAVKKDGTLSETRLRKMMVAMVKEVGNKIKGFSRKETVAYYKDIVRRAWQQVETADTPEVRSQRFDEGLEWTMLDDDFDDRMGRTFTGPVYMPPWWIYYRPWASRVRPATVSTGRATSRTPSGRGVQLPTLPGAAFAASIVTGVQSTASNIVRSVTGFTGDVTHVTNPPPKPSGRSYGGSSGGSSCACACACACAGCACACAGGGR